MAHTSTAHVAAAGGVGDDAAAALQAALLQVEAGLDGRACDLAVLFAGAAYTDAFDRLADTLGERLQPRHSLGVTAGGVVAGGAELERPDALSVWAAALPGAHCTPLRYPPVHGAASDAPATWDTPPDDAAALILLADPFTFPGAEFLKWAGQARPGLPVSGGVASGAARPGANRLLLDGEVHRDGAVAIALGGSVSVRTLVSQGCRPVGAGYVVTRARRNLIEELAGEPPVQRIEAIYADAAEPDRKLMRQGLHIGTAIDEYRDTFGRGDFLVRGVLGAEADSGAVAVGDLVSVGQTVQFHVRDADSADEDLRELLDGFGTAAAGALLFTCNGRGQNLFGGPDHDAALVRSALGGVPVAGFFAAGEFGPVGGRSFLHGFTASVLAVEAAPEVTDDDP